MVAIPTRRRFLLPVGMTLGLGKLGENAAHFRIHITTARSFRAKRDRVAAPEENPFRKENHPSQRNQKLSLVAKRGKSI
jgi:hypothetical protein